MIGHDFDILDTDAGPGRDFDDDSDLLNDFDPREFWGDDDPDIEGDIERDLGDTDDAFAIASAGFGTDEDYGSFGENDF